MAYATVTLTGTYHFPDGSPAVGTIEIIPSERMILDDAGNVVISGRAKVRLDEQGSFSVALPATDDPALTPTGFGYTVAARLHHTHLAAVSFQLPAAVSIVDITDVTQVDPSTFAPDANYVTDADLTALGATIPDSPEDIGALSSAAQQGLTFSEITAAPTFVTGHAPLGVIDGELYGSVGGTNEIARLVDGSWQSVVTLPAGIAPKRLQELDNGEVVVNRNTELWLSSGWAANPATATFTKVLEVPNPAETRFPQGYGGVSVAGPLVFATEYGTHGMSRYAWLSTDYGETFSVVFDLHDFPGGTTTGLGGAHVHGVCINPYDETLFVFTGDAAAVGMWYAEYATPTVWTAFPNHPLDGAGNKVQPTTAVSTEWGTLLGSDGDPNGLWLIPHSESRDYTIEFILTRHYGESDAQVVAQHTDVDSEGATWGLFSGFSTGQPDFITGGSGPRNQGIVWEDTEGLITGVPWLIFAHGDLLYVALDTGGYLTLPRPDRGVPRPVVKDSGWVLGGTAPTDQRSTAVGLGAAIVAPSTRSVAVGNLATVTGTGAVAVGNSAQASGDNSVAIGGNNGTGNQAVASSTGTVAIGSGTSAPSGGVALGYLAKQQGSSNGVAIGAGASVLANSSIAIGGASSIASGASNSVAIGSSASVTSGSATVVGSSATGGTSAAVLGYGASATASRTVAIGRNTTVANADSVAIGYQVATTATWQVAVGARHFELGEVASAPAAPAANNARLYAADNGAGKTALYVRFPTGAVQQVAIEP